MKRRATRNSRKAEHTVRDLGALPDRTHVIEHRDGHLERRASETNWARVDGLSDAEITAAVQGDPDAVPLDIDWSDAVLVVPPKKKAISIRLDEDVLDFFKRGGAGYQRRMNAVLRSYMQDRRKKGRA